MVESEGQQLSIYQIKDFHPLAVKYVFEMMLGFNMLSRVDANFFITTEMFRVCDFYGITMKTVIRNMERNMERRMNFILLGSSVLLDAMRAVVVLEKIDQFKHVAIKLEERVAKYAKKHLTTASQVNITIITI